MAEVIFRPVRQLSEYKGKGASASREVSDVIENVQQKHSKYFYFLFRHFFLVDFR